MPGCFLSMMSHLMCVVFPNRLVVLCRCYVGLPCTNIPHSVLTRDVNAHSTLWRSYTDDHRGQRIVDDISNLNHITLNTNTPTRVLNTTLQQTSSPDISTVPNTLYNRTSWTTQHALSSDHFPIITTINISYDCRLQESRLDTIHGRHRVRFHSDHHTHQHIYCQHNFSKHHTDGRQA